MSWLGNATRLQRVSHRTAAKGKTGQTHSGPCAVWSVMDPLLRKSPRGNTTLLKPNVRAFFARSSFTVGMRVVQRCTC